MHLQPACEHAPHPTQHCVGCPAAARNVLEGLLGASAAQCGLESLALEPRETVPSTWQARYGIAIVRRGYLIRQRIGPRGRTAAVDAVGPGCTFPLDGREASGLSRPSGYAVSRALVCLCDEQALSRSLELGGATAVQVHDLDREAVTRMERFADARARPGARAKVATLLCTLADTLRPGQQGPIPSQLLQRDMAALLSIRHESVCRVLRELEDEHLIERSDDGIALLARAELDAM